MPWDDDYSVPREWTPDEVEIYDRMVEGNPDIGSDQFLQALYDEALFHDIHGNGSPQHDFLMEQLIDYLRDTYGIEFDDVFDWEQWRRWYEQGAK